MTAETLSAYKKRMEAQIAEYLEEDSTRRECVAEFAESFGLKMPDHTYTVQLTVSVVAETQPEAKNRVVDLLKRVQGLGDVDIEDCWED